MMEGREEEEEKSASFGSQVCPLCRKKFESPVKWLKVIPIK
jgi:hypothetical protein